MEGTQAFGDVYLGLVLWRMLGLGQLLDRVLPKGRELIPWPIVAAILALARFWEPSSELHAAQTWYRSTGLEDLLGVALEYVDKDRLYRAHDKVLPFKEEIEKHLKERFSTLFDAEYDLLLYGVTSTYFEGGGERQSASSTGLLP